MFFLIITSLALAYWPILLITSVMIFDAPGSTDKRSAIYAALAIVFMPMMIGVLYFVFDQSFWGIQPKSFFVATIVLPVLASLIFGYPKLLMNSLKGISSDGYFIKEDKVYYDGQLTTAKPAGFETVDESKNYARDSENVYFRGQRIEGADPENFKAVGTASSYFRDHKNIYFEGKVLDGSDAATFIQLQKGDQATSYYKDKNAVYCFGLKLEGLSPESVKVLSEMYLVDANSVFYFRTKISGADPQTFKLMSGQESWAEDKRAVYHQDVGYPDIDGATLEILERGYAKDKSKVYYRDHKVLSVVEGADPATFRVTNWDEKNQSEATDGSRYYLQGKAK